MHVRSSPQHTIILSNFHSRYHSFSLHHRFRNTPINARARTKQRCILRITCRKESPSSTRLFSNLDEDLKHQPGNVFSSASLVAGTAIGAGILALPAVCQPAGFTASSVAITGCALYSITSALLIAEVAINTMCELGSGTGVSLNSMARLTLGNSIIVSVLYTVLHYSLLVACTFPSLSSRVMS